METQPTVWDIDVADEAATNALAARVATYVGAGDLVALSGELGSGKTTLIRAMCGLLPLAEGSARVLGHDARREAEAIRARIGYMSQKFSLYEDLTARENMDFYAGIYGLPPAQALARKAELTDLVGLGPYLDRWAGRLSGGWKQRLALACALLHRPDLVEGLGLLSTGAGYRNPEAMAGWNDNIERQARALEKRGMAALPAGDDMHGGLHTSAPALAHAIRGFVTQHDSRIIDGLTSIDVPALVLVGAKDKGFLAGADHLAAVDERAAVAPFRAGLVDECHLFIYPVIIGDGKPSLPHDMCADLELLDEQRFSNGVVYVRYRVAS